MKKLLTLNVLMMIFTACSFISCEEDVTDDKGIVQSIEVADNYDFYKKRYKVEVEITLKSELYSRHYTLYTDKSYRVGDSIYIK